MNEIKKVVVDDREIVVVDYSDCNEDRMIEVQSAVRAIIRAENKRCRLLAIFNDRCFLTPKVMKAFNDDLIGPALIDKTAVIGLTQPKKWIIEGHNFLENNTIAIFESKEDAINYLVG